MRRTHPIDQTIPISSRITMLPRYSTWALTGAAILLTCLAACKPSPARSASDSLTVLAAVSLTSVLSDIGKAFNAAHPSVNLQISFGASNQLRIQLEHGASGDLFVSADRRQMDAAVAAGIVDPTSVRVIASNTVALIVPKSNRAGITGITDLMRPGLRIVVADPAVPLGHATRLMLERAVKIPSIGPPFVAAFEHATVSREENAAAVVAKIALNEGDAAIAYASDASGPHSGDVIVLPLPDSIVVRTDILAARTSRAVNHPLADEFIAFLCSDASSRAFISHYFHTPDSKAP